MAGLQSTWVTPKRSCLNKQTANSKKSFLATLNTDEPLYVRNFYAEASFMGKASWQALRL